MSDNYQLKFTLLNFDESLTKLQHFNKALKELNSRGLLTSSQKDLVEVVKKFEAAATQAEKLSGKVGDLTDGLNAGYKAAKKVNTENAKVSKGYKSAGSEAEKAAKKIRNALKNLDYTELKKGVKELRTGMDMSDSKMGSLEKKLARFNKAAKEVNSPEVRKAFSDMFGTTAARDLNKINGLMKEGNALIRQRRKDANERSLGVMQTQAQSLNQRINDRAEAATRKRALEQIAAEKMYQDEIRKTGVIRAQAETLNQKHDLGKASFSEKALNAEDRYKKMLHPLSSAIDLEKARTSSLTASLEQLKKVQNAYTSLSQLEGKAAYSAGRANFIARYGNSALDDAQAGKVRSNINTLSSTLSGRVDSSLMSAQKLAETNAHLERTKALSSNIHQTWRGMAAASGNIWLSWGNFLPMLAGLASAGAVFKSIDIERKLGWQMEMVGVAADTGASQVSELRNQVLELGTSGIVQGPIQLANALRVLTQAGMDTKEAFAALKPVTDLALVAEVSDGQAAQFMAGARSAFNLNDENGKLDALKFRSAADQTAKAAAVSQTSIEKMMEALKQGSSEAEKFNLSIADTSTVLAALARYNIEGSSAGTALKNFLTDIAGRTPKARKALSELGLTIYTASGEMKPFMQVIEEFQTAFDGMNSQDKQTWLRKIFNERGMRTANVLLSMTNKEVTTLHNSISRASENMGYTSVSAKRLADTSEGAFLKMKNGWEGVFATVGGNLQKPFMDFMAKLTEMSHNQLIINGVQSLGQGFLFLGQSVATTAAFLAKFTPQIGAMGSAFMMLALPALIKWVGQFGLIAAITSPVSAVLSRFSVTTIASAASMTTLAGAAKGAGAALLSAFPVVAFAALTAAAAYYILKVEDSVYSFKDSLQSIPSELASVKTEIYEAFNGSSGLGGKIDYKLGIGVDTERLKAAKQQLPEFALESARTAEEFTRNINRINTAISTSSEQAFTNIILKGQGASTELIQNQVMVKERHISLLKEELAKFDAHMKGKKTLSQEERDVRIRFENEIFDHSVELMNQRTELVKAQLRQIKAEAASTASAMSIMMGDFGYGEQQNNVKGARSLQLYESSGGKAWFDKEFTKEQMEKALQAKKMQFKSVDGPDPLGFKRDRLYMEAFASANGNILNKSEFDPKAFLTVMRDANDDLIDNFKSTVANGNQEKIQIQLQEGRRYIDQNPDKLSDPELEGLRRGYNKAAFATDSVNSEKRQSIRLGLRNDKTKLPPETEVNLSTPTDSSGGLDRNTSIETKYAQPYTSKFDELALEYAKEKTENLKKDFERQKSIFGTTTQEAAKAYIGALEEQSTAADAERLNKMRKDSDDIRRGIANGDYVGDSLAKAQADVQKYADQMMSESAKGPVVVGTLFSVVTTKIKDATDAVSSATGEIGNIKAPSGKTQTVGSSFSGLNLKGKQATAGGSTSAGVIALAQVINSLAPNRVFTAFNDLSHKGYASKHNQGLAGDVRWREGRSSAEAFIVKLEAAMAQAGLVKGVHYNAAFEGTGKPNKNGTVSSGDHIHFQAMSEAASKFIAEQLSKVGFSASDFNSASTRNVTASGKKGLKIQEMSETPLTQLQENDGELYLQRLRERKELTEQELSKLEAMFKLKGTMFKLEDNSLQWKASELQIQEKAFEFARQEMDIQQQFGLVSDRAVKVEELKATLQDIEISKAKQLLEIQAQEGLTKEEKLAKEKMVTWEFENQIAKVEQLKQAQGFSDKWQGGLQRGFTDIANQAKSWGDVTAQAVNSTFTGMSDSLGELFTTGSTSFRDMTVSILSDLSKLLVKMALVAAIKAALEGMSGSSTNWVAQIGKMGVSAFGGANAVGGAYQDGIKYFAKGGTFTNSIVSKPTMFKSGGMLGVMGEAGPEAILPLTRTSSGNLGVEAAGFGGGGAGTVVSNQVTVTVQIQSDGSSTEQTQTDSAAQGRQLGNMISARVKEILVQESRPGGLVYNAGKR